MGLGAWRCSERVPSCSLRWKAKGLNVPVFYEAELM